MRKKTPIAHSRPKRVKRSKKIGLPPGSLVYLGKPHEIDAEAHYLCYNSEELYEKPLIGNIDELYSSLDKKHVNWLIVNGIHNTNLIKEIGEVFNIEALILEDILNTDHRPKFEETENSIFFTLKLIEFDKKELCVTSEQVSFILGENYVISFQENHSNVFDQVIERIKQQKGRVRWKGNDYLMYILVDILVDNYFTAIEEIEQNLEDIEDNLALTNDKATLQNLQSNKRSLLSLRRLVYPLRDQVNSLLRSESIYINERNIKYFRDLQDHLYHIVESIDDLLDINEGIKEMHVSNLSLRMNQIMQTLTLFTAIFTPLTFLAGVYGMNFDYIPELKMHNGYYILWTIWVTIVVWLLFLFKRRKWL